MLALIHANARDDQEWFDDDRFIFYREFGNGGESHVSVVAPKGEDNLFVDIPTTWISSCITS